MIIVTCSVFTVIVIAALLLQLLAPDSANIALGFGLTVSAAAALLIALVLVLYVMHGLMCIS